MSEALPPSLEVVEGVFREELVCSAVVVRVAGTLGEAEAEAQPLAVAWEGEAVGVAAGDSVAAAVGEAEGEAWEGVGASLPLASPLGAEEGEAGLALPLAVALSRGEAVDVRGGAGEREALGE